MLLFSLFLSARLDIRKMQLFVTKEFNFHFVVAGESVILCEIKIQKEKEKKTKIAHFFKFTVS